MILNNTNNNTKGKDNSFPEYCIFYSFTSLFFNRTIKNITQNLTVKKRGYFE